MSTRFRFAALLLAAALCGCGGGEELNVGEVAGVVTLDGKPLPNAVVSFIPKAGGPSGIGKTDAEGKYQLMTVNDLGAVVGEHMVSIVCVPEAPAVESYASDDPRYAEAMAKRDNYKPVPVTKVPERYNLQTELVEQVESGSNEINFDLKS
jgi:hypothetical protein